MPPKGQAELAHPQAADWVTGTLGPDDVVLFQFHLRGCPHCQAAIAEFGQLGQLLRQLPPAAEPPPALEARTIAGVLAAAAADRARTRAGGTAKVIRFPRWRSRTGLLTIASAVAAAVIAVLLVVPGLGAQKASFAFQLAPPRGPGQAASAASGSATARQDSSGSWNITLTVRHLEDVGPERWYECWYVSRDGQAVSAGTFVVPSSGNGTFPMTSSADPRDFQSMEITVQPASKDGAIGHPIVLSGSAKKL
ncbi:MAG TPA: anti-sigma factor [Streptosporangiaceae bacterium]|nr:anti-sigma factor [Streptosporangiaceae bacterium]